MSGGGVRFEEMRLRFRFEWGKICAQFLLSRRERAHDEAMGDGSCQIESIEEAEDRVKESLRYERRIISYAIIKGTWKYR